MARISYYKKLQDIVFNPAKYGLRRKTKVYVAVQELSVRGIARTGKSGFAFKEIWTGKVIEFLQANGFPTVQGNDAPRGGATGEFVKIDSDSFNKEINKRLRAIRAIERQKYEDYLAKLNVRREKTKNARKYICKNTEIISRYHVAIQERFDNTLSGDKRKKNRKRVKLQVVKEIWNSLNTDAQSTFDSDALYYALTV